MLRRIADHLFWAARNLERAEWRARLVRVNYHPLIETAPRGTPPWEPLLRIFGEQEAFSRCYEQEDDRSILNFFTLDIGNLNSIRSCINVARNNLSALRHHVSSELWFNVNRLYLEAQDWSPQLFDTPGVWEFFSDLEDDFYRIAGIRESTIARDLAYDFMQLGIMVERAEDVTRMLDVKYHFLLPRLEDVGGPIDLQQWAAVLRSASALETYRKQYGNAIRTDRVIEMLVFDPTFPRSARYAIDQLSTSFHRIAHTTSQELDGELDELLGEFAAVDADAVITSGLHEFLLHMQDSCSRIYSAIHERYLKPV